MHSPDFSDDAPQPPDAGALLRGLNPEQLAAVTLPTVPALILAGATPHWPLPEQVGLVALWGAAALTLVTGWDYLRVGLKHMD